MQKEGLKNDEQAKFEKEIGESSEKTQAISGNGTFSYRNGTTTSTAYIDLQRTAAHSHGDTWYQSDMRDESFDTNLQDSTTITIHRPSKSSYITNSNNKATPEDKTRESSRRIRRHCSLKFKL